ncbi:MAG: AAA family ATPase [Sedimenticola sp.]
MGEAWSLDDELERDQPKSITYPLVWARDITPKLDNASLIQNVLKPESMIVTYGESNSGKTFHVLDQDLCIATGRKWFDKRTDQGLVVYIAAEGPHSVQNRISAYRNELLSGHPDPAFALMPCTVNLLDSGADTYPITDFIKSIEDQHGKPCVKVTVDTLARAMAGGNENGPDDMGQFVTHADYIRHQLGCAIHLIHHSGKDTAKGARGHSSLRAATDTEIEVRSDCGLHIAKITKQRDWATDDEYAFRLRVVELGNDQYGDPVTTCVPEWEMDYTATAPKKRLSQQERMALDLMKEVMRETKKPPPAHLLGNKSNQLTTGQHACPVGLWRDRCKARKLANSDKADSQDRTFRRILTSLQSKEKIKVFEDWSWLID